MSSICRIYLKLMKCANRCLCHKKLSEFTADDANVLSEAVIVIPRSETDGASYFCVFVVTSVCNRRSVISFHYVRARVEVRCDGEVVSSMALANESMSGIISSVSHWVIAAQFNKFRKNKLLPILPNSVQLCHQNLLLCEFWEYSVN
jgi:hypothetical protein